MWTMSCIFHNVPRVTMWQLLGRETMQGTFLVFCSAKYVTITYKLCLFMHQIHNREAPPYLSDCVSTVSASCHRYRLRLSGSAPQRSTFCLEQEADLENLVFLLWSGRLEHSTFWPSWRYWYQYFRKTAQEYFVIVLTTDYYWRSCTCRIAVP